MAPTRSAAWSAIGTTVQSCPEAILPTIELPRGRNETVSPAFRRSMWCVAAHPMGAIVARRRAS